MTDGDSGKKGAELLAKLGLSVFVSLLMLATCEVAVRGFLQVRNVGPSFTMYSPVYGRQLRPSISVTRVTPEFVMRLSTNSEGFRQPDEVPLGSRPVLFLGDSFTMGYGVNDGDEFVALIRSNQPVANGPFLNAGMGHSGNGRWLKFLTREAPRYAPRLVVLQVMNNDFADNLAEGLFLLRDGKLIEEPIPSPGPREWMQSTINRFPLLAQLHLVGLLRQVHMPFWASHTDRNRPLGAGQDGSANNDELTFQLVDRAIALCQEQGWPVLGLSVGLEGARLERMKQLFAGRRANLLEAPTQHANPELYYEIDGHWNAQGHAYVADLIAGELPRYVSRGE